MFLLFLAATDRADGQVLVVSLYQWWNEDAKGLGNVTKLWVQISGDAGRGTILQPAVLKDEPYSFKAALLLS